MSFNTKNPQLQALDDELAALRALALEMVDTTDIWWDTVLGEGDAVTGLQARLAAPLLVEADSGADVLVPSATTTSLCSVELTAGWWEIEGIAYYPGTAGVAYYAVGIGTASDALPAVGRYAAYPFSGAPNVPPALPARTRRVNVTDTTTYHLVVRSNVTSGPLYAQGWLSARYLGANP